MPSAGGAHTFEKNGEMVWVAGFEPAASRIRTERSGNQAELHPESGSIADRTRHTLLIRERRATSPS
jgi:hypothetical protein